MENLTERTQVAANLATILGALLTVIAVWLGYGQFRESQELQREALTTQLFAAYNAHWQEHHGVIKPKSFAEVDIEEWFWANNAAFYYAEAVYVHGAESHGSDDPLFGWRATVAWMLERQRDWISPDSIDWPALDPCFAAFAVAQLGLEPPAALRACPD